MKKFLYSLGFITLLNLYVPFSFATQADDILGLWISHDGMSCAEFFKRDNLYFARIVGIRVPNYLPGEEEGMDGKPRLDMKNPDESLRSRPLLGLEFLNNFEFNGKDQWENGKLYDPESGNTYKGKMTLKEDGVLALRGYIGISLLGRTAKLRRPETYIKETGKPLGFDCPYVPPTEETSDENLTSK